MNTFSGQYHQHSGGFQVSMNGETFKATRSFSVRNHSPDGFSWGYCGSGPAQLALAILLEETDQPTAERLYQQFKFDVIAGLPDQGWRLTSNDIQDWLRKHNAA